MTFGNGYSNPVWFINIHKDGLEMSRVNVWAVNKKNGVLLLCAVGNLFPCSEPFESLAMADSDTLKLLLLAHTGWD